MTRVSRGDHASAAHNFRIDDFETSLLSLGGGCEVICGSRIVPGINSHIVGGPHFFGQA